MVSQAWSLRQGKIPLASQHPWNLATQSPGEWCLSGPPIRVVPQGRAHHGTAPLSRTPDGRKTESLSLSRARPQSFISRDRCIHASIYTLQCLHDAQWGGYVQNPRGHISTVPAYLDCIVLSVCACLLLQWPNFGGQLLSMQLGEGGMGLSQGQRFRPLPLPLLNGFDND